MRSLEIELGWLYVAPGSREKWHTTNACPEVVAGYKVLKPGDGGYSHILNVLSWCEWCQKYEHGLVEPLE